MRGGKQRGNDRVCDLIFDDIGGLAFPGHVHNDLDIGNVRQGIQRDVSERPDSSKNQQQCSREDEESIACAPINDSGDHGYIPPSAFRLNCLVATAVPFLIATTVSCHVPPLSRFTRPSYSPPPFSVRDVTTFIAAMPICGMAGM